MKVWRQDLGAAIFQFSPVQLLSCVQFFAPPWTAPSQASLSITNPQSLFKLMSIELVMPFNHLILCQTLLFLPSIFPRISVFSSELVLRIRWPKYWSFSFNISLFNEHPGLILLDWLDLLAVQGTHKSLLQHHSSEASILQPSAFFVLQFSHPHMTTGKTMRAHFCCLPCEDTVRGCPSGGQVESTHQNLTILTLSS